MWKNIMVLAGGAALAFARGIAEAHGGTLVAASDGPGTGATFTPAVPLA